MSDSALLMKLSSDAENEGLLGVATGASLFHGTERTGTDQNTSLFHGTERTRHSAVSDRTLEKAKGWCVRLRLNVLQQCVHEYESQ